MNVEIPKHLWCFSAIIKILNSGGDIDVRTATEVSP